MKMEKTYGEVIELLRNNTPEIENAGELLHSIMSKIEHRRGVRIRRLRIAGAVSGIAALLLSGFLIYEIALPEDYLYRNTSYTGKTVLELDEKLPMQRFDNNPDKACYFALLLKNREQNIRKERIYAIFVERMKRNYSEQKYNN